MLSVKEIKNRMEGNKVITGVKFQNQLAYDLVVDNATVQGGRKYVTIPMELLEIDETYQRIDCISMDKVKSLVAHFDINKCDPILVAPHPETCTFSVINGSHRMIAHEILKINKIGAVLADDLPAEPKARKIAEAKLFCEQNKDVDHMTPSHKHNAYVTMGIKKHIVLEECLKGRKLLINKHILKNKPQEEQDRLIAEDYRILTGYTEAVRSAANSRGKELLNMIFDIIEKSGWHSVANGYSKNVIRTISSVINLHNFDPEVNKAIIDIFTPIEPNLFMANAHAEYPGRTEKERLTMWLEREVAHKLGVEPIYTGGDMRSVTSKYNIRKMNHVSPTLSSTGTEA